MASAEKSLYQLRESGKIEIRPEIRLLSTNGSVESVSNSANSITVVVLLLVLKILGSPSAW